MSPRTRLGAALLVPEPIRREVDGMRAALGDGSLGMVPAHLTLVPPVNVNDRDLGGALRVLREAAASTGPFTATLGPPASFLPDNPVLYLEVGEGTQTVLEVRARVFRPPLERTLSWPYVPHVTLCDEGDPGRIEAGVRALADYRATVTFTRLHLLRHREGIWEPWADAVLGGHRVVGRGGLEIEITETEQLEPDAEAFADAEWAVVDAAKYDGEWRREPFALTARHDGRIVGVASGWTNLGVAHLSDLIVAADARRLGIGSRLLATFEHLAYRRECHRLSLRTVEGSPAQAVYERKGWQVEATFEDWTGGLTSVQMRKDL